MKKLFSSEDYNEVAVATDELRCLSASAVGFIYQLVEVLGDYRYGRGSSENSVKPQARR